MKVRSPLHPSPRRGLTLIELVVVLLILVALAGVLVPMLPSMLTRTHVAAHTTNVTELTKVIVEYQALNNAFPNNWDSMVDPAGNQITYLAGGVLNPTPGSGGPGGQAGGTFTVQAPTQPEVNALLAAGINSVYPQSTYTKAPGPADWASNPFDPTFANYATPPTTAGATTISTTSKLTYLTPTNAYWNSTGTPAGMLQQMYPAWSTTANYVVLGIGERCTLIGKMALTPPVHFSDTQDASPAFSYGRFVAIFKVSDPATPGGVNMAQFMTAAAVHAVGPTNLSSEFQNWNQISNGGS
jgi:prepilin-type N-terminal cleavage/methylation domain-containing protein